MTDDLASALEALGVKPEAYVSGKQLPLIDDPSGAGGTYIPLRNSPLGNFTDPLYSLFAVSQIVEDRERDRSDFLDRIKSLETERDGFVEFAKQQVATYAETEKQITDLRTRAETAEARLKEAEPNVTSMEVQLRKELYDLRVKLSAETARAEKAEAERDDMKKFIKNAVTEMKMMASDISEKDNPEQRKFYQGVAAAVDTLEIYFARAALNKDPSHG